MSGLWGVTFAPPLDSYPPLPYRGEDFRAVVRLESCACGGVLAQRAGESVPAVVEAHNAGHAHRSWRGEIRP